jgi:DNA-directed RNA polymerase I, II, and III subunit RPABC3
MMVFLVVFVTRLWTTLVNLWRYYCFPERRDVRDLEDQDQDFSAKTATSIDTTKMANQNISRWVLVPDDYRGGTPYPKRQKIIDRGELHYLAKYYKIEEEHLPYFYCIASQVQAASPYGATPSHFPQAFERLFGFTAHPASQSPRFADEISYPISPGSIPTAQKSPQLFLPQRAEEENPLQLPTPPSSPREDHFDKMATAGDSTLFDEMFTITSYDQSKYDRVARIGATSSDSQTVMTLDINIELFPCNVGETIHCMIASSLSLDGSKDDPTKGWRDIGRGGVGQEATLADMFDYVCHGKIYKFEDGEDGQTM